LSTDPAGNTVVVREPFASTPSTVCSPRSSFVTSPFVIRFASTLTTPPSLPVTTIDFRTSCGWVVAALVEVDTAMAVPDRAAVG
jgi:hypothetical protein